MAGEKPHAPKPPFMPPIPRGSGEMRAVAVEELGATPSFRPPAEEGAIEIATRAQGMAQEAIAAVQILRAEVAGVKVGIEEKIQATVTTAVAQAVPAAIAPVLTTLGQQNVEMLATRGSLSKITRMLSAQMTDEQNATIAKMEMLERSKRISVADASIAVATATVEQKQDEHNIHWVKKYRAIIALVVGAIALIAMLASYAGWSQHAYPHGVEERPE